MNGIKKNTSKNLHHGFKFSVAIALSIAVLILSACFLLSCSTDTSNNQQVQSSPEAIYSDDENENTVRQDGTLFPSDEPVNIEQAKEHTRLVVLNNNQWTKENETLIAAQLSCAKLQAQQRQADALAKATAEKNAQKASLTRNDVSYAHPAPTTSQQQTTATYIQSPPTQAPDTINVLGAIIPFIDAYDVTRAPEHGAGVWRGDESTTDGGMCYFVGHNPGDFHNVMLLQNGDVVTVCDTAGQSRTYKVRDCFTTLQKGTYNDVRNRVEGHGESIVMQTCCGDGVNVRIVVAW